MGRSDEIILWMTLVSKPRIPIIYLSDRKKFKEPWKAYYKGLVEAVADKTRVNVKPTISEEYPPSITSIPSDTAFLAYSDYDWLPDSYLSYTYSLASINQGVHIQTMISEFPGMIARLAKRGVNPSVFLETLSVLPAIVSLSHTRLHRNLWFVRDTIRFKLESIYGPGEKARYYLAYITRLAFNGKLSRVEDAISIARVLLRSIDYVRISTLHNGYPVKIVLIGDMLDRNFMRVATRSRRF